MDLPILYRSKAPFRLGIAGGGTDVSPYSDLYGGAVLNVTIDRFAYATIRPTDDGKIRFIHINDHIVQEFDCVPYLEPQGPLMLQCGIYNRIVRQFNDGVPFSFELTTKMDVPSGSGLGTSSTLVVAILGAFVEGRNLPLGKYDIARLAYEIERIDLGMAGGKQDQYAATFGGVNFMEFLSGDRVIVNPLSIPDRTLNEWAFNTVLLYTNKRRESARIIEEQMANVQQKNSGSVEAMLRPLLEPLGIPVLCGFPAGHGGQNVPLLMGAPVTLDVRQDGASLRFDVPGEQVETILSCLT